MPRMDGFDLARNIRGDKNLSDLPIIMITSRIAEKHRDHAKELELIITSASPTRKTNCCLGPQLLFRAEDAVINPV